MTREHSPKIWRGAFLSLLLVVFGSLFFWIADTATNTRLPDAGKPPSLYANQTHDDLGQTLAQAIDSSRQSVLLIIYSLTDSKIISALRQKSEEGIPVKVICDAKASPHAEQKLGSQVQVVKRFSRGLMHQKILVIDGQQNWIGSANMTSESLRHHGNLITAFNSPDFANTVLKKAESMKENVSTDRFPHHAFVVGGQQLELCFLPDDTYALDRLTRLIRSAQKTIRVAMFTWTRTDLAQEIIKAQKRGVKTEIVIDRNSAIAASSKVVKMLSKAGIDIKVSRGTGLLHHKLLYIDEKILVNGSANWTKAAFCENDDCFVVLHNLDDSQRKSMNDLWDVITTDSSPVK